MEIGRGCAFISSLNVLAIDGIDKVGLAYGGESFRKQRDVTTAAAVFDHIFAAHVYSLRRGLRGCPSSNPDRRGDPSRKDARGG
jgi:hypothetical protein